MPRHPAAGNFDDTPPLTADDLLTMELYAQREGALTPDQTRQLLQWVATFRPLIEGN